MISLTSKYSIRNSKINYKNKNILEHAKGSFSMRSVTAVMSMIYTITSNPTKNTHCQTPQRKLPNKKKTPSQKEIIEYEVMKWLLNFEHSSLSKYPRV